MKPRRNQSAEPNKKGARNDESGPRRQARACAVQMLYALEATQRWTSADVDDLVRDMWVHLDAPPEARPYGEEIVRGVMTQRDKIDEAIRAVSAQWRLERMSAVDRNVLRVGAYEIIARDDVPVQVAINECIDLARAFGTAESSAFVNGLLDKLARSAGRL